MYTKILIPELKLRNRAHEHGQRLEGKAGAKVPGNPRLFEHTWKNEEHQAFVRGILNDTATIENHTDMVVEHIKRYAAEAGIQMGRPFQPLLLLLESGIQWIKPDQLALLLVLRIGATKIATAAVCDKEGNSIDINLEVGSVLLLYGDIGWQPLESNGISFLHIPVPVERMESTTP